MKRSQEWEETRSDITRDRIEEYAPATYTCIMCQEYFENIISCTECGPVSYFCERCFTSHHAVVVPHYAVQWSSEVRVALNIYTHTDQIDLQFLLFAFILIKLYNTIYNFKLLYESHLWIYSKGNGNNKHCCVYKIFLFFLQFNVYESLPSTMCSSTLLRPDHNCTSSRRDSIIVINERGSFLLYYIDKL